MPLKRNFVAKQVALAAAKDAVINRITLENCDIKLADIQTIEQVWAVSKEKNIEKTKNDVEEE